MSTHTADIQDLLGKIEQLEAEKKQLHKKVFQLSERPTVSVPPQFKPIFDVAQKNVKEYFEGMKADPSKGTIEVRDQRYVLVRASAMSYDFLNTIKNLYADRGEKEALMIGKNFLFDIAHVIGMNDAKNFHKKMKLTDPIAKLSAGPVHFAYSGWAFVDILPESKPSPDENYFLIYHHPYSFEADSWMRAGQKTTSPVCVMNAGYSSGWCEESFGIPLTSVEIACKAKGDANCTFIMAPPHKIKEHVHHYLEESPEITRQKAVYDIPTFFERKKTEEELKAAKAKAEESDRLKTEFLATMSHEIRTPLNGIIGAVNLLLEEKVTPEQRDYLETIRESGRLLMSLIGDVLDFSKIEAGQLLIEQAACSLADITNHAEYTARALIMYSKRKIEFKTSVDAAIRPYITTDIVRIKQILNNLLGNAIKFTKKGNVELGIHLGSKKELEFYVKDTGIGIPKDKQQHLFQMFRQGDATISKQYGGTGLGLAITKKLVELLGGTIKVSSRANKGTKITFTLPYVPAAVPAATRRPGKKILPRTGEHTVLLVEDNPINLKITHKILEKAGYRVLAVNNGKKAITRYKAHASRIDLILMDVQMPDMDGMSTAKVIRHFEAENQKEKVPLIALTAHVMKGFMERCMEAGFDHYLTKPVDNERLLGSIKELIG